MNVGNARIESTQREIDPVRSIEPRREVGWGQLKTDERPIEMRQDAMSYEREQRHAVVVHPPGTERLVVDGDKDYKRREPERYVDGTRALRCRDGLRRSHRRTAPQAFVAGYGCVSAPTRTTVRPRTIP